MKKISSLFTLACLIAGMFPLVASEAQSGSPSPILVELFTSEGCSSCPPADSLLQQLDRSQPVSGAQLIVLSEHVDYWNHIGWTDPYSSSIVTSRQDAYASHFGISSVYTPQMVVDGTTEFVGNDRRAAEAAIEKARANGRIPIRLWDVAWDGPGILRAHVEAGPLLNSSPKHTEIFFVTALDHAESQVLHGENKGRRLTHVAVVLSLTKVGVAARGKNFSQDIRVKLDPRDDLTNLRAIAFVQESGPGRVLGAVMQQVTK